MKRLMGQQEFDKTLDALAERLAAQQKTPDLPALVGIRRRGCPLAERLAARLEKKWGGAPDLASLDIAFYRDDLSKLAQQPVVGVTDIPFSLDGRSVCLVDDVLYTGRTIRAALDALLEFGRPSFVRLAVLIDRGHRELPIQADYIGLTLPTSIEDDVRVMIRPIDDEEGVFLQSRESLA